jgi:hypothetical protein
MQLQTISGHPNMVGRVDFKPGDNIKTVSSRITK